MKLNEIYRQIARQSGIEGVFTFSNSIPGCFKGAFAEIVRLRASEDSPLPMFEDEMLPLIGNVNVSVDLSNGIGDYLLTGIDRLAYVYGVSTADNRFIPFKYVSSLELNDMMNNEYTRPSVNEGYWAKNGSRIRIANGSDKSPIYIQILVVKNPDVSKWNDEYDFSGYGFGFIQAVINRAIDKLQNVAARRGVYGNDPKRNQT